MIVERKIILKKSDRKRANPSVVYDGPKNAKKIDLAYPNQDSKLFCIAPNLDPNKAKDLIHILQEFKDVFA